MQEELAKSVSKERMIRVLIVNDNSFQRLVMSNSIGALPMIGNIIEAANG